MYQPVQDFYNGRSVFITGVTGFLGKVLLQKLLYQCPGIRKIYVLIRDKKNTFYEQRLQRIFLSPLFESLREGRPDELKKVIAIRGDVSELNLGICSEDAQLLQNEVSIVIHMAAIVRFDETLRSLINTNTMGTQRVIEFCYSIKQLKTFVYVSTAYSQTQDHIIEEKIYNASGTINEVEKVLDEYEMNPKRHKYILRGKANEYTLSKALAENLVAEACEKYNLPAIIIRPSIISQSYKDLPGWIDSWTGATGLYYPAFKGLTHVWRGRETNILDLIPVDYVVGCIIVATARYYDGLSEVLVYNICTSSSNPLTFKHIRILLKKQRKSNKGSLTVGGWFTDSCLLFHFLRCMTEVAPAAFLDSCNCIRRKRTRYLSILSKTHTLRKVLQPFTTNSWEIQSTRTESLASTLSTDDRRKYHLDPRDIDWDEYFALYFPGIEKYLIKPKAQS